MVSATDERPQTVPPIKALASKLQSTLGQQAQGPATSLRPSPLNHYQTLPQTPTVASIEGRKKGKPLGIKDKLIKEADGVVKRRDGGVLTRGFILKTDHYPTGRALDLDITIQGAPNFRCPDEESLNVFGVAQPTLPGLKSILTLLQCQPPSSGSGVLSPAPATDKTIPSIALTSALAREGQRLRRTSVIESSVPSVQEQGRVIWFSTREETLIYCNGRPYVLRDASAARNSLALSDRADNLEDIERRLKIDILREARRYGGLILTHDELSEGNIVATWVSVDEQSVQTPRELYESVMKEGWNVEYHRIPIGPDRPIEDNYLDAYVSVLKDVDPLNSSLVFNCGMGVVRTTFAMVAALLVRRKQYLLNGLEDPFPLSQSASGIATPHQAGTQAAQFLEQATQQQAMNKSLLRVTRVLDRNMHSKHPASATDLLAQSPPLLESLRKAHMGNYQVVLSLLSSLDNGREVKRLVDTLIDTCDSVVNLREAVVEHRIKYSVAAMDDHDRQIWLDRALRSLEQYFDLIAFASYVEEEQGGNTGKRFSAWLKSRPEIWNQIKVMRRHGGARLHVFAPVSDLSLISRTTGAEASMGGMNARFRDVDLQGGKVLGDEWAEHVVNNRSGIMLRASTLLKSDLWLADAASSSDGVRGAIGFRQIPDAPIFATGQPTEDAISRILDVVKSRSPSSSKVVWVCLREEPLVMINGSPYCLRRDSTALRNLRDYSGVSSSRLEILEDRLKSDVLNEIRAFQGRLLLHTETSDGYVAPVWESVDDEDVASLREIMDRVKAVSKDIDVSFVRLPITSESSPDFHDITELLELCIHNDLDHTAMVLNDQLGRGRSTNAAVIVLLIQRWLLKGRWSAEEFQAWDQKKKRGDDYKTSWQIINSVLRVIRSGLEVKRVVDEAIDRNGDHFNLRDAIEDTRARIDEANDPDTKKKLLKEGRNYLQRYFRLIVFQAYLDDTSPSSFDEAYSFEAFVKHRPVFKTLEKELEEGGVKALDPLERMDPADGMALPDEVSQVVANRSGGILSAQTILKSDFFSGLQKLSLPERVDGAANYRRAPLLLHQRLPTSPSASLHSSFYEDAGSDHYIYGTGMPSAPGLRNALTKMGAGPSGKREITWTSLREEPVLYVKSRPHVLRLIDRPVTNIETTGVNATVVERMEEQLKADVLAEMRKADGRILLHDEVEIKPGHYDIVPIWETIQESEVMTPKELYDQVQGEGFKVHYLRIAITDEQAPLPAALAQIVSRVVTGLEQESDFVFNCQMGRGRTTTGMAAASLIATIAREDMDTLNADADQGEDAFAQEDEDSAEHDSTPYLQGDYKVILQLVSVLSHGKLAKRLTDKVIDAMEGVQNLRKAIHTFKLQLDAAVPGSAKYISTLKTGVNYLYRYGTLVVLANFLLENKENGISLDKTDFPAWMAVHREIRSILTRKTLD